MTNTPTLAIFGQSAAPNTHLSPMARGIASRIGGGAPAPFAGFMWYQREDPYQSLRRQVEEILRTAA